MLVVAVVALAAAAAVAEEPVVVAYALAAAIAQPEQRFEAAEPRVGPAAEPDSPVALSEEVAYFAGAEHAELERLSGPAGP